MYAFFKMFQTFQMFHHLYQKGGPKRLSRTAEDALPKPDMLASGGTHCVRTHILTTQWLRGLVDFVGNQRGHLRQSSDRHRFRG